ncbi:PREDICTED: probable pectinesterase 8 isoform X2 [Nicotiana attenuata]|uniref:Pectinesterase n=1 Tax=Nicotiana attenuata TaxID=49451 RepID=A0A1J6L2T6_NICAT|nr:PREDICTED: probable pectinesterase 8 isoform X2 [Nicotiana attenuata]OIT28063.1 putative pectinesterase 8 [Nicotiana attenuata]
MNIPKSIYFPLSIAIVAILASISFKIFDRLTLEELSSPIISRIIHSNIQRGHHRHHRDDKKQSICDNFSPNFPTIDPTTTSILCVDHNGCCNFTAVQAAVDSVGNFSATRTLIWINSGIYFEKVIIPKNKPNITFQGQGYTSTAIVYNDNANSSRGTFYSGSVQVFSTNFIAKNISFMNVAPIPGPGAVGAQAVAIRIGGDQAAFWGCGFFGAQDTLHDDRGRHYFKECYIQGSIDFVFGNGKSLYENCQLISMASPGSRSINGAVTAHGRGSKEEDSGFAFVNCNVGGSGRIWLGRAWRPFSTVVFANTFMTDIISPDGWSDLNDPSRDQTIFYGEYNCSGAGSNMSQRAPYVQKLNDTQALPFLSSSFIDADQWLQSFSN